jgi:hypothetical protein
MVRPAAVATVISAIPTAKRVNVWGESLILVTMAMSALRIAVIQQ